MIPCPQCGARARHLGTFDGVTRYTGTNIFSCSMCRRGWRCVVPSTELREAMVLARAQAFDDVDCVTCEGTGECMGMVCYGDMPLERMIDCPDCGGTGKISKENQ